MMLAHRRSELTPLFSPNGAAKSSLGNIDNSLLAGTTRTAAWWSCRAAGREGAATDERQSTSRSPPSVLFSNLPVRLPGPNDKSLRSSFALRRSRAGAAREVHLNPAPGSDEPSRRAGFFPRRDRRSPETSSMISSSEPAAASRSRPDHHQIPAMQSALCDEAFRRALPEAFRRAAQLRAEFLREPLGFPGASTQPFPGERRKLVRAAHR